ncbi:DUF1775 domain-containing protein [Streptomyces globisporus]|uniref:DUF1775 domain-containing protein n=1 Tax=Streptomyces TaxID=1883 RepID=UPI00093CB699|nr:DUF1775 domain-containing protein [Streptomyces sp. TSRI0445]
MPRAPSPSGSCRTAKTLAFKTLQSYDDGRVNRWVELEKSTGRGQGHSAPVLELQEVAPGTEPLAPMSAYT